MPNRRRLPVILEDGKPSRVWGRVRSVKELREAMTLRLVQGRGRPGTVRRGAGVYRIMRSRADQEILAEHTFPRQRWQCRPKGRYVEDGVVKQQLEDGPLRFWGPGEACPWFRCRHHLGIFVNPENGSIAELGGLDDGRGACALDLADQGPMKLEDIGAVCGVTRERIRQIEGKGMGIMRRDDELAQAAEPDAPDPEPAPYRPRRAEAR